MIASILVVMMILECFRIETRADSAFGDGCQTYTELDNGYCPSTCEVEDEMRVFYGEMEEYLTQQDVFLQEVKQGIQTMRAIYDPFDDMILTEIQRSLQNTMGQLQKGVADQLKSSSALQRNVTQLKSELANILIELESVQDQCEEFCSSEAYINMQKEDITNDARRSDECGGGDALCFKAAHTATATVVQESENGILCPQFETEQAKSCAELYNLGYRGSGIYRITPSRPLNSFHVFCDMQDSGGGWTVIQRRRDGSVDFNRSWQEYAAGFGGVSCSMEFWLGNENLKEIGHTGFQTVRFVMTDWENETRIAQYSYFKVNSAQHLYTLQLSYYQQSESNCSDSMTTSGTRTNAKFATWDRPLSPLPEVCDYSHNGWWADSCQSANLNGYYHKDSYDSKQQPTGIIWPSWKGADYSLRATEIKLRPYDFSGNS